MPHNSSVRLLRGADVTHQAIAVRSAYFQEPTLKASCNRSVVALAFGTYEKEFQKAMDPTFRATAIDQIKTFIFAGHDTTSSTIAYAFYFLHMHPSAHARLCAELDAALGPSATSLATLKASPRLINALPCTTAVFKETLRIFPPASTLRPAPANSPLTFTDPRVTISSDLPLE